MHTGKINLQNLQTKEAYQKAVDEAQGTAVLTIVQEIVDRFAIHLKYPEIWSGDFLYQLRVGQFRGEQAITPIKVRELLQEVLSPLGWRVSSTWNSTTMSYDFTIK